MTGSIIEFIILLLSHAAAGIYSSALKYSKRTTYIIWCAWILVQSGLLIVAEFFLTNTALQFFSGFLMAIIGQYIIFLATTKGRIAQRIFTMLTYSIFFCITMSLFTMIKGTFSNLPDALGVLIHAAMLLVVLLYFLRYVCPLCRSASKNITKGWFLLIFVNVVFLFTVILASVFPTKLENFHDPAFVTYFFLIISITVVYPVIFSNINNMSEAALKREVEAQNRLLLAQIDAEAVQMKYDSHARHDRRHHNLIMLEFANNNDIESVREYLRSLVESDTGAGEEKRYCDNITVNTILAVYARRAQEKGVAVNVSASISRDIDIPPKDLGIVIANLFENAINATEKLNTKEKHIDIFIKESAKRVLITVENSCKRKMQFDENHYGVGIYSVIETVDKYVGMYDFSVEDGIFSAKISMNLK